MRAVAGSWFHQVLRLYLVLLPEGLLDKIGRGEIPRRIRDAPFVQIPLGVTEDRLVGTVDIEASMKVGGGGEQSATMRSHVLTICITSCQPGPQGWLAGIFDPHLCTAGFTLWAQTE